MQVFPNPDNPIWTQNNTTDLFGNLYATRNINLERVGYIGLSRRMKSIPTPFTNGRVLAMTFAGSSYKGILPSTMVSIDPVTMVITTDTTGGASSGDGSSDIIYWNNTTYYTNSTSLQKLSGTYSSVMTLTTASYTIGGSSYLIYHPICLFDNKILLAIGDGNIVRTIDEANTPGTSLVLPKQYMIDWIRYFGNKLYIGTRNISGGDGNVFVWDGATAQAEAAYPYYAPYACSGIFFNSTLYIWTIRGQILQFTGGGFREVARFPFLNKDYNVLREGTSNRKESMIVLGDQILIGIGNVLWNGSSNISDIFVDNFYSGVWSYDKTHGLTHKYSTVMTTDITTPTEFGKLNESSGISLFPLVDPSFLAFGVPPLNTLGSTLFISSTSYDFETVLNNRTLMTITTGEARGYFQTKKIININFKNNNKKLYLKYRGVTDTNDKIILKYKEIEKKLLPSPTTLTFPTTWTSSTTFTSSSSLFGTNVSVGDEIELLYSNSNGAGAGYIAHITSIVNNAGTYTITIDETITGAGVGAGNFMAIKVDNFKKLMTVDSTTAPIDQEVEIPIDVSSKWISIKVEMRGEDVEIEQLILVDSVDTPAV